MVISFQITRIAKLRLAHSEKEKGSREALFPDTPEADIAVPDTRFKTIAVRSAEERWIIEPTPPAQYFFSSTQRALRIPALAALVVPVPIRSPLPDVAQHVVKSEPIGNLLSHSVRRIAAVSPVPRDVVEAPISGSRNSAPSRVLPLSFRWQAPAGGGAVVSSLFPAHSLEGQVVPFEAARRFPCDLLIRSLGDRCQAQPKPSSDFDVMRRFLRLYASAIALGTPQSEVTRRNPHIRQPVLRIRAHGPEIYLSS